MFNTAFNNAGSTPPPCVQDDDSSAYVVYSSEDNRVMHIGRLSADYLRTDGPFTRAMVNLSREAPAVFKHQVTLRVLVHAVNDNMKQCIGASPSCRLHVWTTSRTVFHSCVYLQKTCTHHDLPRDNHPTSHSFAHKGLVSHADQWLHWVASQRCRGLCGALHDGPMAQLGQSLPWRPANAEGLHLSLATYAALLVYDAYPMALLGRGWVIMMVNAGQLGRFLCVCVCVCV